MTACQGDALPPTLQDALATAERLQAGLASLYDELSDALAAGDSASFNDVVSWRLTVACAGDQAKHVRQAIEAFPNSTDGPPPN